MPAPGGQMMLAAVVLIVLLWFSKLNTIPLLMLIGLQLLDPVFSAFKAWIEMLDRAD
jgi:hypothetical protein